MAPNLDPRHLVVGVLIAVAVITAVSALALLPALVRFVRTHRRVMHPGWWPATGVVAAPVWVAAGAAGLAAELAVHGLDQPTDLGVLACITVAGVLAGLLGVHGVRVDARADREAHERVGAGC